jgi:N-acetylneuraminic acid mutarotase
MIYAVGGCIGHDPYPRDVALVHRYDPALDAWTEVAPLPQARSHFEPSSFVRDGRIVLVGGRSRSTGFEAVADVTEYDPVLNRWRALPPLPEPRHSPIAVMTSRGIVAGLGGRWGSDPNSTAMWRYQPGARPWIRVAPAPVALSEVSAAVIGHRVYVVGVGGPWTLAYDLETGRWDDSTRHAARPAVGNHHAAEVWHDRLYLFGGVDRGQGIVQIYDPVTESWRLGPPMPFAAGSSASALIGDQIYVAGGIVGPTTTTSAARFDPAAETWTPIAPMPIPRNHAASATDGKRLFVFGGRGPGSGDSNFVANGFDDVQIYDPATDHWTVSRSGSADAPPPLPQPRGGMGKAVFARGEFWILGGETLDGHGAVRGGVYDRVDIYDPVAKRWRLGPPMAVPRHGIFPVLLGDEIFVPGGGLQHGVSSTRVADLLMLPPAR